jgi:hypothetical protein
LPKVIGDLPDLTEKATEHKIEAVEKYECAIF